MTFTTFHEPAAWLLAVRAELDAVGCVPFGGGSTREVEVISGDISRSKSRDFSASFRPAFGTEAGRR